MTLKVSFVTLALMVGMFVVSAMPVHAQYFDGCALCGDAGYTDYSYGDAGYTDYGYTDPGYTDYGYYNPGYTDYGYYDAGYTDYGYTNPGYTDYGYYGPGYTDYGYSTPGYGYGGGYYGGGGYSGAIPTWPMMSHWGGYAASPVYSYMPSTYVDRTPIPTWPANFGHVTATPTSVGTPSHQTQTNTQTNTQAQNTPVTVVQSQAPINNSNTNNINISVPAQYTFPSNYQAPTCSISVTNSYYNSYNNQPVTLTWSSNNAYSATISPNVGSVNPNGSTTVYPTAGTTIYTMTVYGQGGTGTCQTQVVYQNQPTYQAPVSCNISANPASVQRGQYSYLTWNSYGATSASLSDGTGSVSTNGSLSVRPDNSRSYTLTVWGPQGQSATCQTTVNVAGGTYVSLTQIPYTGFDFGPTGNAIYWLSLLAFAVALAYLAIYYKGGVSVLFANNSARTHATHRTHTHAHVVPNAAPAAVEKAPVRASALANLPTRELRNTTTDSMTLLEAKSADEMPRIVISRN